MKQAVKNNIYDWSYFTSRDMLDMPIALAIKQFMTDHHLKRVLDVGCGSGRIIKFLRENNFDAYGCDVNPIAVKMARKLIEAKRIRIAPAEKLLYPSRSFDLILSISVVEHLRHSQVDHFLKETLRILRPGGYIFLVTPNITSPLRLLQGKNWGGYMDPSHINFYTPHELTLTLTRRGFTNPDLKVNMPYNHEVGRIYLSHVRYIPQFLKAGVCFLFFSTPLRFIRNSFWVTAQKNQ